MDMLKVYLDIVVLSIIVLYPVIVLSLRAGRKLHGSAQPRLVSGDGRVGVEVVREGGTANMVIIRLLSLGLQTILIHGVSWPIAHCGNVNGDGEKGAETIYNNDKIVKGETMADPWWTDGPKNLIGESKKYYSLVFRGAKTSGQVV